MPFVRAKGQTLPEQHAREGASARSSNRRGPFCPATGTGTGGSVAAYDGYQTVERASKAWIASSRVTSRAPIDNAVA